MNSLLVAWRPVLVVAVIAIAAFWFTGRHGLALVTALGLLLLIILLATGNLGASALVAVMLALIVALNFGGVIHSNEDRPICYGGYHWNGPWRVVWAVGTLEFRTREWYCAPDDRFDRHNSVEL